MHLLFVCFIYNLLFWLMLGVLLGFGFVYNGIWLCLRVGFVIVIAGLLLVCC